jgi:arginine exporter protein ArgO
MNTSTLLAFALVALVTVVTPGPTVLLALNNGSRHGLRMAATGVLGAVLSDFVLIAAVALGLGALLAASELAFGVLKWLGVVYLSRLVAHICSAQRMAAVAAVFAGTVVAALLIVSLMDLALMGRITADYLITGLVTAGVVAPVSLFLLSHAAAADRRCTNSRPCRAVSKAPRRACGWRWTPRTRAS